MIRLALFLSRRDKNQKNNKNLVFVRKKWLFFRLYLEERKNMAGSESLGEEPVQRKKGVQL